MPQGGFSKIFKALMIILTGYALVADNELISAMVLVYWVTKGVISFLKVAAEGGAFDR